MRSLFGLRTRRHWLAAMVVVAAGVPGTAEAQLFPNLPIHKRHRHDCSQEPPVYKMVRYEYYGYHPTCWHRFPPGWGCWGNPEVPNVRAVMEDIKKSYQENLRMGKEGGETFPSTEGLPGGPGMGTETPSQEETLPTLPPDRSPFAPDAGPARGGATDVEPAYPLSPPATTNPSDRTPGPRADLDRNPPAEAPGGPAGRTAALLDLGPVPDPGALPTTASADNPPPPDSSLPGAAPADQPPPRRGLLSGLFQNLPWRRR
jgi:hypothetical protein